MITIIVPTLNEYSQTESLLGYIKESVSKKGGQLIVADSPLSTDGIGPLVQSFGFTYLKCEGKGRARQMNEGVGQAKHDILCFLHADVRPPQEFIQLISETLSSKADFGYFSYRFDKESIFLKVNGWFTRFKGIFTGGGDQILFMRKDTYIESGGFDADIEFMEDFEYHERLKNRGYQFTIINHPACVSARKYDRNSYLKVNLVNFYTLLAFKLGSDPEKLKKQYQRTLGR